MTAYALPNSFTIEATFSWSSSASGL
jgi:hypothetical protein